MSGFSQQIDPESLLQKRKGFYIENMKELFPAWREGDPYLQYPNLRVQSFGGSTSYILIKTFPQELSIPKENGKRKAVEAGFRSLIMILPFQKYNRRSEC